LEAAGAVLKIGLSQNQTTIKKFSLPKSVKRSVDSELVFALQVLQLIKAFLVKELSVVTKFERKNYSNKKISSNTYMDPVFSCMSNSKHFYSKVLWIFVP